MQRETVTEFRAKRSEALSFLKQQVDEHPDFLIILGTGLGNLADEIDIKKTISYANIPHFPVSTVESHAGRLLFGTLSGKKVVAMQGRFPYYGGNSMTQSAFPFSCV